MVSILIRVNDGASNSADCKSLDEFLMGIAAYVERAKGDTSPILVVPEIGGVATAFPVDGSTGIDRWCVMQGFVVVALTIIV